MRYKPLGRSILIFDIRKLSLRCAAISTCLPVHKPANQVGDFTKEPEAILWLF